MFRRSCRGTEFLPRGQTAAPEPAAIDPADSIIGGKARPPAAESKYPLGHVDSGWSVVSSGCPAHFDPVGCRDRSARRTITGETSRLRLSFVGALLEEDLVGVLKSFRKLHAGCQLHLTDLPPAAQLEALLTNRVDGAFIGAAPRQLDKRFSWMVWKREPLLVAMPEKHPLAAAKTVALARLKNEPWVMVSRAAATAFRQQFDRMCGSAGVRPQVVQESERVPAVLTMIAVEQGISLLPESVSRLVHPGVVFRPLKAPVAVLEHAFAYPNANKNSLVSDLSGLLAKASRRTHP